MIFLIFSFNLCLLSFLEVDSATETLSWLFSKNEICYFGSRSLDRSFREAVELFLTDKTSVGFLLNEPNFFLRLSRVIGLGLVDCDGSVTPSQPFINRLLSALKLTTLPPSPAGVIKTFPNLRSSLTAFLGCFEMSF